MIRGLVHNYPSCGKAVSLQQHSIKKVVILACIFNASISFGHRETWEAKGQHIYSNSQVLFERGADRVIVILLPPAHFSSLSFGRVTAALRGVLQPGEVRAAHSSRSTVALR